jgi:hypothetical protein
VNLWQNRASWPGVASELVLPLKVAFPTLKRFVISLPSSILALSVEEMNNLPPTLVEIDLECLNAESLWIEPIQASTASFRSLCFQTSLSRALWGFVNVNMGQRFPQLQRLRLIGGVLGSSIVLPRNLVSQDRFPHFEAESRFRRPNGLHWTHGMAYNFIRELPPNLTSLTCDTLITLAKTALNKGLEVLEPLPFPQSITEIHSNQFFRTEEIPAYLKSQLTSMDVSPAHLKGFDALTTLKISHWPDESQGSDFEFPINLTALHFSCVPGHGASKLKLPPKLKIFDATRVELAEKIPTRWFPESLTKLRLSRFSKLAWGDQLEDYLPPRLEYLKIGFKNGNVDFKALPRSLKIFKFAWYSSTFKREHITQLPPQLTSMAIYNEVSHSKSDWAAFPSSLTDLKLGLNLIGVLGVLQQLPALTRAKLNSSSMSEDHLPMLPYSLRRLELGEVILTGSSLLHFSPDDHLLTSQKWSNLMKSSLPPSLELLWDFQFTCLARKRGAISNVAITSSLSNQFLYFPSHLTEIDLRGMNVAEERVFASIESCNCKSVVSVRLDYVSLSPNVDYPPTLTTLEAGSPQFINVSYPRIKANYTPLLKKLVIPSITMSPSALPAGLTHLELHCISFSDSNQLTQLETLVMNQKDYISTEYLPPNLTSLQCPHASHVQFFESGSQLLTRLTTLKLPNHLLGIELSSIPKTVTFLQVYEIHADQPLEQIQKAIKMSSALKIEKFDARIISRLLASDWLPDLQFVEITSMPKWNATLEQVALLPEDTKSLSVRLGPNPLNSDSHQNWEPEHLLEYAKMRKSSFRPLQIAVERLSQLTELNLKTALLPHFATEWLPRSLKVLYIDNSLFSTRSYAMLPLSLHCLGLTGQVTLLAASTAALPQSLHHLHLYSIKSNAFSSLPRDLRHLCIHDADSPLWPSAKDLPLSLTSLDIPWVDVKSLSLVQARLPINLRALIVENDSIHFRLFQRIKHAGLLPQTD